jgi:excisionase family DNA binding protein
MNEYTFENAWSDSGSSPPSASFLPEATGALDKSSFLTVKETAKFLNVSESWVRRHLAELPATRIGRLLRFDPALLSEQLNGRINSGKSLKSERKASMPNRFQRGWVKLVKGKRQSVWYGGFREDVITNGKLVRVRKKIKLGTARELPTKAAALNKLAGSMKAPSAPVWTFDKLVERWEKAEGPTMKPSTLTHYKNCLRYCVAPTFSKRRISDITREDIQTFLASQAKKYSKSVLRSARTVLSLTLGWAKNCGWIERNPCAGVKLPLETAGKKVQRTVLTSDQINSIANKLQDPYATLVLFLRATGLRIGEAIATKWSDFDGNILKVERRIYEGEAGPLKTERSERRLTVHPTLLERIRGLRSLHPAGEWVFCSEVGTPINPGNALKRYVRPAANELGIHLGGWHDFRHTLTTTLRRNGVHPKVISGILGHARVNLAMDTYDHVDVQDFEQPLEEAFKSLLPSCYQNAAG